jgi:hypothetical protein
MDDGRLRRSIVALLISLAAVFCIAAAGQAITAPAIQGW